MGRRSPAGCDEATHPGGIQPSHIRWPEIVSHQDIRSVRRRRHGHATEVGQDPAPDIPQIRGTFGQQTVRQRFLGPGRGIYGFPPACLGGRPFVDRFQRSLVEIFVLKHFHVNRENRRGFAAFRLTDQGSKLTVSTIDGLVEALDLLFAIFCELRIFKGRLSHDESRCQRQSGRCGNRFNRLIIRQCGSLFGFRHLGLRIRRPQWRNFFTQAAFNGAGQRLNGLACVIPSRRKQQRLTPAGAQADHPSQAGSGYCGTFAFQQAQPNTGIVATRLLDELLGGSRV